MKERVSPEKCPWYKGPSLFEMLDNVPVPIRNPEAPIRIPVLDKMRDLGLFLFGKVESGTITTSYFYFIMFYNFLY
jgi:peptide chain release factor subunit 3